MKLCLICAVKCASDLHTCPLCGCMDFAPSIVDAASTDAVEDTDAQASTNPNAGKRRK